MRQCRRPSLRRRSPDADAALGFAAASGHRWFVPETLRIKGELLALRSAGDREVIADLFREAIGLAREQDALYWELSAAISLAELFREQNRDVEAREVLFAPAVRLATLDGLPTTVVAFTTDIPTFEGTWGQPFLIGPGSIHVAHTAQERIPKRELAEAAEIYARMVRQLLATGVLVS